MRYFDFEGSPAIISRTGCAVLNVENGSWFFDDKPEVIARCAERDCPEVSRAALVARCSEPTIAAAEAWLARQLLKLAGHAGNDRPVQRPLLGLEARLRLRGNDTKPLAAP